MDLEVEEKVLLVAKQYQCFFSITKPTKFFINVSSINPPSLTYLNRFFSDNLFISSFLISTPWWRRNLGRWGRSMRSMCIHTITISLLPCMGRSTCRCCWINWLIISSLHHFHFFNDQNYNNIFQIVYSSNNLASSLTNTSNSLPFLSILISFLISFLYFLYSFLYILLYSSGEMAESWNVFSMKNVYPPPLIPSFHYSLISLTISSWASALNLSNIRSNISHWSSENWTEGFSGNFS